MNLEKKSGGGSRRTKKEPPLKRRVAKTYSRLKSIEVYEKGLEAMLKNTRLDLLEGEKKLKVLSEIILNKGGIACKKRLRYEIFLGLESWKDTGNLTFLGGWEK